MSISLTHTKTTTPAVSTAAVEAGSCPSEQQQQQPQHAESVTITWTIRQDPLVVTLDGRAIFFLAVSLILGVHVLPAVAVAALAGAVPLLLFVHNDYLNYLKLGPGGTPPTPAGYLRINWYKLWQLRTPFEPLPLPGPGAEVEPAAGLFLRHEAPLPPRAGPRPTVVGIAPQRQTDQFGSRACYVALRRALARHAARHADDLAVGTSCFEKHGLGLFARRPVNHTCRGEVCHVHDSDHSLHLNLHPDDAREVLAKGWGQRHPLTAARGPLVKMPVPRTFTMVYAPRTADELHVVCRIIQAAGWWVMAKDLEIELNALEKSD